MNIKETLDYMLESFKKEKPRTYLMRFLKSKDPDEQRNVIAKQIMLHYKDNTNPFQELTIRLTSFNEKGFVDLEGIKDEVRDWISDDYMARSIIKGRQQMSLQGEALTAWLDSDGFNERYKKYIESEMDKVFEHESKYHYILVTTDDAEYQRELESMEYTLKCSDYTHNKDKNTDKICGGDKGD